ncbi:MAG TPA: hypothetical protein VKA27_05985 [Sunxiuqinia sp.]|nr:hypothetical protein [Sunxiuqinia sp.]
MYKEYLQTIDGVHVYAIVGFAIFFLFFIAVTIHTFKMDKQRVNQISQLPLDEGTESTNHLE